LAPKQDLAPKFNVTADSSDVKSLVTPVDDKETSIQTPESIMQCLGMFQTTLNNVVRDIQALKTYSPHSPGPFQGPHMVPSPIPPSHMQGHPHSFLSVSQPQMNMISSTLQDSASVHHSPNQAPTLTFVPQLPYIPNTVEKIQASLPPTSIVTLAASDNQFPAPEPSVDTFSSSNSDKHDNSNDPNLFLPAQVETTTYPPSLKPMSTFNVAKWTKEVKEIIIEDKSYDSVPSWYDVLQQAMIIATNRSDIIPGVDQLTKQFDFRQHILPGPTTSIYKAGHLKYMSI